MRRSWGSAWRSDGVLSHFGRLLAPPSSSFLWPAQLPKTTPATPQSEDKLTLVQDIDPAESGPESDQPESIRDKAYRQHQEEEELKPFQAELIRMQQHLEQNKKRMIILFEGRDAAGKGGTIRRVTRYMNEKHYRVVALGKPTESEKTEWFFQKYIRQFPCGGEVVLFDRSWYNRAMVEPVFGFCTEEEHKNFNRGVSGFEKDLIRHILKFERESFKVIFDVHNFDGVNAIDILLTVSKEMATKFINISPGITYDLKTKYPDVYKRHFKSRMDFIFSKIKINLHKGISQGIYRDDLSIELIARLYLSRLIDIHNSDFFPPEEFNFDTLFEAMFESHIRSIANEKGLKYWEKKKKIFKKELKKEDIQ